MLFKVFDKKSKLVIIGSGHAHWLMCDDKVVIISDNKSRESAM